MIGPPGVVVCKKVLQKSVLSLEFGDVFLSDP